MDLLKSLGIIFLVTICLFKTAKPAEELTRMSTDEAERNLMRPGPLSAGRSSLVLGRSNSPWLKRIMRRRSARCDPDLVEPVVIFPHQRVEINCAKCPNGRTNSETAWRFQAYSATNDEKVSKRLKVKLGVDIDDDDAYKLTIKEASDDNSGRYYCKNGATYLGNYDVTYVSNPQFHVVIPDSEEPDFQPLPDTLSNETNEVTMYTEWGSWGRCNHCAEPGERVKIGLCYARTRLAEFPAGVPCRSNVVPYKERAQYSLTTRMDEKMLGSCNVPCPPKPQSLAAGLIIRTFSLSEGIPTLPQLVKRRVYYEDVGKDAELVCPEVGVTHGVRWKNGTESLNQMELLQTNSRLRIDGLNRLVLRDVQLDDTGNFTCWFENEKIAVVILNVVQPPTLDTESEANAMYLGIVIVFLVVFYIVFGIFRNRRLEAIN